MISKIKGAIRKSGKYSFSCADVGMNCGFQIEGSSSEDELLKELSIHARLSQKMESIPQDTLKGIKQKIKVS